MSPEIIEGFPVRLRAQDADALLAAAEGALNARLDFGPGIRRRDVEEAAKRIESVAALAQQGIKARALDRDDLILALANAASQCEQLASNIARSGDQDWAMGLAEQHAEKVAAEIRTVLRGDVGHAT